MMRIRASPQFAVRSCVATCLLCLWRLLIVGLPSTVTSNTLLTTTIPAALADFTATENASLSPTPQNRHLLFYRGSLSVIYTIQNGFELQPPSVSFRSVYPAIRSIGRDTTFTVYFFIHSISFCTVTGYFLSRGFTDRREILHGGSAASQKGFYFGEDSPRDGRVLGLGVNRGDMAEYAFR